MKHLLWILPFLYIATLLQTSFLVHFFPSGMVPNLIVVMVVGFALVEKPYSYVSFAAALFGGFLLDIFSGGIIGFWASLLLVVSMAIKLLMEDYVRLPIPKKF